MFCVKLVFPSEFTKPGLSKPGFFHDCLDKPSGQPTVIPDTLLKTPASDTLVQILQFVKQSRGGVGGVDCLTDRALPSALKIWPVWLTFWPKSSKFEPQRTKELPERSKFLPERSTFWLERSKFWPERSNFWPRRQTFLPKQSKFWPEWSKFLIFTIQKYTFVARPLS